MTRRLPSGPWPLARRRAKTRRSARVSHLTKWSSWMEPRSSEKAARSRSGTKMANPSKVPRLHRLDPRIPHKADDCESVPSLHHAAGGHRPVYGRHSAGWGISLSPVTGLGPSSDRLSHDPGLDLLSRCQSRRHGFICDGPARATIRADARIESDDLHKFRRQFGRDVEFSLDLSLDVAEQQVQAGI